MKNHVIKLSTFLFATILVFIFVFSSFSIKIAYAQDFTVYEDAENVRIEYNTKRSHYSYTLQKEKPKTWRDEAKKTTKKELLESGKQLSSFFASTTSAIINWAEKGENADHAANAYAIVKDGVKLVASCFGYGGIAETVFGVFDTVLTIGESSATELQNMESRLNDQFDQLHTHIDEVQKDLVLLSNKISQDTDTVLSAIKTQSDAAYARERVNEFYSSNSGNFNYNQFANYIWGVTDASVNSRYLQAYYHRLQNVLAAHPTAAQEKMAYDDLYRSLMSTSSGDSAINRYYEYLSDDIGGNSIIIYYYTYMLANQGYFGNNIEYKALDTLQTMYETAIAADNAIKKCNLYYLLYLFEQYGDEVISSPRTCYYYYGSADTDRISYQDILDMDADIDKREAKLEKQIVKDVVYILNLENSFTVDDSGTFSISVNAGDAFGNLLNGQTIYLNALEDSVCAENHFDIQRKDITYKLFDAADNFICECDGSFVAHDLPNRFSAKMFHKDTVCFVINFKLEQFEGFSGGSGTKDDPYLISNSNQLRNIDCTAPTCYKLIRDINASGVSMIGSELYSFIGTFDGNGHSITGFSVETNGKYAGLFAVIGESGIVVNLTLVSPSIQLNENNETAVYVGGIAGVCRGKIYNCHIFGGTIIGKGDSNENNTNLNKTETFYVGGIAGLMEGNISYSSITNAEISCDVSRSYGSNPDGSNPINEYIGGICGIGTQNSQLNNCYSENGSIIGKGRTTCKKNMSTRHPTIKINAGGIAGQANGYVSDVWSNITPTLTKETANNGWAFAYVENNNCKLTTSKYVANYNKTQEDSVKLSDKAAVGILAPAALSFTYAFAGEKNSNYENYYLGQLFDYGANTLNKGKLQYHNDNKFITFNILKVSQNSINIAVTNDGVLSCMEYDLLEDNDGLYFLYGSTNAKIHINDFEILQDIVGLSISVNDKITPYTILSYYGLDSTSSTKSDYFKSTLKALVSVKIDGTLVYSVIDIPYIVKQAQPVCITPSITATETNGVIIDGNWMLQYNNGDDIFSRNEKIVMEYRDGSVVDVSQNVDVYYIDKNGDVIRNQWKDLGIQKVFASYNGFETSYFVYVKCIHDFTETVVAPTCSAAGYTLHSCVYCDYSYRDTLLPREQTHTYIKYSDGEVYVSYVQHNDDGMDIVYHYQGIKAPTCLEIGYTGDFYCTVCGKIEKGEEINALGHLYQNIDDANYHACAHCGTTVEHSWKNNESGNYIIETCAICNYQKQPRVKDLTTIPRVIVSDAYALGGDIVSVYVQLLNNPGITSVSFSIVYDERLILIDWRQGNILPNSVYKYSPLDHGKCAFTSGRAETDYTFNGNLLRLFFRVPKSSVNGDTYKIEVTNSNSDIRFTDNDVQDIDIICFGGTIKVTDHLPGDVNGDGKVDILDATLIAVHCNNSNGALDAKLQAAGFQERYGDVTFDDRVNTQDLVRILQYLVGGYDSQLLGDEFNAVLNFSDGKTVPQTITLSKYDNDGNRNVYDLPDASWDGYRFDGWYDYESIKLTDSVTIGYSDKQYKSTHQQTYYAHWTINRIRFGGDATGEGEVSYVADNINLNYTIGDYTKTYTVTYVDSQNTTIEYADPIRFTLLKWVDQTEKEYEIGQCIDLQTSGANAPGDIVLSPVWQAEYITLPANVPTKPKTGYTLNQWKNGTVDNSVKIGVTGDTIEIVDNTRLYAYWDEITYYISYNPNAGTGNSMISTGILFTDNYKLKTNKASDGTNVFTRLGYIAIGWAVEADGSVEYEFGKEITKPAVTHQDQIIELYVVWQLCTNHTPDASCICSKCGVVSHTFDDNCVCTRCGTADHSEAVASNAYCRHGNYLYFGTYPQTEVTDESIVATLNTKAGSLPSDDNSYDWNSYGYTAKSGNVVFPTYVTCMWYKDISVFNQQYRGVYLNYYRYENSSAGMFFLNTYQDDNGYTTGSVYWFKYEPIKWRVLSEANGEALIFAEMALDSQEYYPSASTSAISHNGGTGYANNYALSNIRKWLNETFYNTAFNDLQKALIQLTQVDNSARSTNPNSNATAFNSGNNTYACANTQDYIFLLSEQEVTNSAYGFDSSSSAYDTARRKQNTDYARCQGAYTSTDSTYNGNGYWWLRSPVYSGSSGARIVIIDRADLSNYVYITGYGVVPALRINFCPNGHTLNENCICTVCGTVAHTPNDDCVCTVCGTVAHNIVDCICTRCGAVNHSEAVESNGFCRHDEYIYFGTYPQSEVADSATIAMLASFAGAMPTADNAHNWTSYGYYIEGEMQDYMWYTDIDYNGEKYRGVYFTQYRQCYTSYSSNSVQDDNGYATGNVYWFRYEPIQWRILSEANGEALIFAEMALDSQEYCHYTSSSQFEHNGGTGYPNNYALSNIRKWLNETFYNTAFNDLQKELILLTTVDNSARSTNPAGNATQWNSGNNTYACANTDDYIFLLSEQEVTNSAYGFNSSYSNYDTARRKQNTDYARCQGAWTSTDSSYKGNGYWWLRSPIYNDCSFARYVYDYGNAGSNRNVRYTYGGVVPALKISLS